MATPAIPILIYGTSNWARLLTDELSCDPRYKIIGFTCDPEYLNSDECCGYPLYDFTDIEKKFPPAEFQLLVCGVYASPHRRAEAFERAKRKNYRCPNFISAKAVVSPTAQFGENNFIYGGTYIDARCRFGNNNVVRPNSYIGHETQIGDTVFIAPGCNIAARCVIADKSMIGIGSTVLGRLKIGPETLIEAGSLLLEDASQLGRYSGSPAQKIGEISPESGIIMEK